MSGFWIWTLNVQLIGFGFSWYGYRILKFISGLRYQLLALKGVKGSWRLELAFCVLSPEQPLGEQLCYPKTPKPQTLNPKSVYGIM